MAKAAKRLTSVIQLVEEAESVFDYISYRGSRGQPGVSVLARKELYGCPMEALFRVASSFLPKGMGYGATNEQGSRISYLRISYSGGREFQPWDPECTLCEGASPEMETRHDYETDPIEAREMARLVLELFSR